MRRSHKSFGRKSETENSLWNRRVGRKITFLFFACVQFISLNIQQSSINVICNKEVKETGNSFYSKIHITNQVQEMLKQYKTRS